MRYKAVISYKGTGFYGFQIQKNEKLRSVEGELEKVLQTIFSHPLKVTASGRTDAGVHALGQVIHFDVKEEEKLTPYRLRYSMNCLLPEDIHVVSLEEVSNDFHARFSAVGKTYRYVVSTLEPSPFYHDLVCTYKRKLDMAKVKEAMKVFTGTHDFHNFCSNDEDFVRTVYSFDVTEKDGILTFEITGNGFRRYMVRMLIGTVLEAGIGRITVQDIENLLNDPEMHRVRYKAPAEGLYLEKVDYGGEKND